MIPDQMQVESVATSALVPYAHNARTHSAEQISQIAASILEFGFVNPVLVDEGGGIIAGHGRVMAASSIGMHEVPCIRLRHLTEMQRRAYVIADNKLALNAGWDEAMLRSEIDALEAGDFDLDLLGFSEEELGELRLEEEPPGLTDPDDAPPLEPAVTATGDVWVLGVHRVVCGDATEEETVGDLMGGAMADACWTDPPYNVNYQSALAGKIANDNLSDGDFRSFLRAAFETACGVMKPGSPIYVAHADTEGANFRGAFAEAGFKLSGCLIWAKDSLVLGRSDYQWQHEPILYGWKPGAAHRWYGGRKQTTLAQLGRSAFVTNPDGTVTVTVGLESIVISGDNLKAETPASSLIRCEKPARSAEHPTMKPVELISRMLRNSTREGDVVLDIFGGSGSTLIACEILGRHARLAELDPRFVDVIVKRWQNFTGQVARLQRTGEEFPVPPGQPTDS